MEKGAVRGVFLASSSQPGRTVQEVLTALGEAEGFEHPLDGMSFEQTEQGAIRITVRSELGENLLACARWRGVLSLKKA